MGFINPVYGDNFADPQVVAVDNIYYAFATNGPLGNVQTLKSPDLVAWEPVGDALPALAPWTNPGRVWAPEVAVHAADRYVMYYTSADTASGRQAVGVAVASKPEGPYIDKSPSPLINQVDEGGSIDAAGPGHNMVLNKDNRDWFIYHAWDPTQVGTDPNGRTMWLSQLTWINDTPAVQPPLRNNPTHP